MTFQLRLHSQSSLKQKNRTSSPIWDQSTKTRLCQSLRCVATNELLRWKIIFGLYSFTICKLFKFSHPITCYFRPPKRFVLRKIKKLIVCGNVTFSIREVLVPRPRPRWDEFEGDALKSPNWSCRVNKLDHFVCDELKKLPFTSKGYIYF
jgi:hypothetical protein